MNRYEMIQKNIIYEENIFYKKSGKQYIGCLIKSKYADDSDQIQLYLFENKPTRNFFLYLDLIEYEKCIEQKKDTKWKSSFLQKSLVYFELIPKHQQQKEIFASETEENRIKWINIFNENIEKLHANNTYEYEQFGDEDESTEVIITDNKSKPAVPPKTFNSKDINKKLLKPDVLPSQAAFIDQLNQAVLKPKKQLLNEDEIFYRGTFEDLQKILVNINKPGVYAVSPKTKPKSDCTLAIRVYKNAHGPILSWNIYHNEETNEYFLFDDGPTFSNIVELCLYYTEHDFSNESNTINRLIVPYKHYWK